MRSIIPAGCKQPLLGGMGGRWCSPQHGRSPWELLLAHVGGSHGWEERGRQMASPAAPQPCHTAGPGGKAILGEEGTGTDPQARDLLFRWQLSSWACG